MAHAETRESSDPLVILQSSTVVEEHIVVSLISLMWSL